MHWMCQLNCMWKEKETIEVHHHSTAQYYKRDDHHMAQFFFDLIEILQFYSCRRSRQRSMFWWYFVNKVLVIWNIITYFTNCSLPKDARKKKSNEKRYPHTCRMPLKKRWVFDGFSDTFSCIHWWIRCYQMLLSSYWHLTSQLLNLFVYYFCHWDSVVCLFLHLSIPLRWR